MDSSSKCNNASSRPVTRCLGESHGKDGKQRTFPTFPRHDYGYLDEPIHEICCTWTLNPPTLHLAFIYWVAIGKVESTSG